MNILLVAGGEDWETEVLKRAVDLSENNHAHLTVVDVVEELTREKRSLATSMHLADLQKLAVASRLSDLEQHIQPIMPKGVMLTTKVLVGISFREIIREVLKNKHDLVMRTARGSSRQKDMSFDNTAMHLLRKCPCPVWLIKPTGLKRYVRILAAVDPDPMDKKRNSLNAKIMELATSLAKMEGSALHILHAWRLYGETLSPGFGRLNKSEVDTLVHEARTEHDSWFAELVERYAPYIPKSRIHLRKGFAQELIPALARRKGIDLIVMGTVSRTGTAGVFVGNTAEEVLRQVDCSVLTVKPDGFITPVTLK